MIIRLALLLSFIMKKQFIYFSFISLISLIACVGKNDQAVRTLDPASINIFTPFRAELNNGVKQFHPEVFHKIFWAENWKSPDQSIVWKVNTGKEAYKVALLVAANNLAEGEVAEIMLSNGKDSMICRIETNGWQRCWFPNLLQFEKGISDLSLKINKAGKNIDFDIHLYSLEIVKPETYAYLQAEAQSLRSNTDWMADLSYGFFFHWNSKSMPQSGNPLPYEEAVNNFDVDRFAKTVYECGGELVFFTTTWAEYYFPAPIKAIDTILPGRTTKRDLVADLSDALGKYGIRLILYYHEGQDDKEWWDKQNYTRENPGDLFTNIEKIVEEISLRYGKRLAGLWMDDGIGYYPNYASFDRITKAAKSGNKDLVICYNPWILPKFTEFQDYYAGETGLNLESAGKNNLYLPVDGSGVFQGGPQEGLQATYSGTLEPGDWTHIYKDSVIGSPMLSIDELTLIVEESNKRRNLPMINVRIYQDGTISPDSYTLLKELNKRIKANK